MSTSLATFIRITVYDYKLCVVVITCMRYKFNFDHCRRIRREMYFGPLSPFSIVVADLTNGVVADLTAVVAELTVADSTCRRVGCRRPDLSPT